MIAGVSLTSAYFRLHEGSIKSPQIVEFLKALVKQVGRKMLTVWDGLKAHRFRLVRDYVDSLEGKSNRPFCRPMRRTSTRSNACGLGSSAMPW